MMIIRALIQMELLALIMLYGCSTFGEGDAPPIANAGNDSTYFFTDTIVLDGSASYDPEGKPLAYIWNPPNSFPAGTFFDSVPRHTFRGLCKGTYTFTLTVFDGMYYSKPDQITVVVTGANIIITNNRTEFDGHNVYSRLSQGLAVANPGDTIFIDQGSHAGSSLIVTNDLFIYGPTDKKAILDGSGFLYAPIIVSGARNITLKNLVIRGGAEVSDCGGVIIKNSNDIRFHNCILSENQTDGLHISNSGNSGKIQIDSCFINDNKYNGIWCFNSSITVRNCIFRHNADRKTDTSKPTATIFITGTDSSNDSILSNSFFQSNDRQIWVASPSYIAVAANVFDSVFLGIYIAPQCSATLNVHNNKFSNVQRHCIWSEGMSSIDLVNQQDFMCSGWTPIWCNGARAVSILNDSIICDKTGWRDINQKGIDIGGCDSVYIAGTIIKNFLIGIILNNSPVHLAGNSFIGDSICICNIYNAENQLKISDDNDTSGCVIVSSTDCLQ
jgi:hypothetical protein